MLLLLLYLLHHASPFKPHVWMKERERGENDKQKEEEGGGVNQTTHLWWFEPKEKISNKTPFPFRLFLANKSCQNVLDL